MILVETKFYIVFHMHAGVKEKHDDRASVPGDQLLKEFAWM